MANPPLSGRRVMELGSMLAAPFVAHILSQLGAEVIKGEPPCGDSTRNLVRGGPSGTFIAYSHGKKSVCTDMDFPRMSAAADGVQPPHPSLGADTASVLHSAGVEPAAAYREALGAGAIMEASSDAFVWAPVRRDV